MKIKVKLKIPILLSVLVISLLPSLALSVKAAGEGQVVASQNKIGVISPAVINDPECSAYVSNGWMIGLAPVQIENDETVVEAATRAYYEKWPACFTSLTFGAETGEYYSSGYPVISYVREEDGKAYQERTLHTIQPTVLIPSDARSNWVNKKKTQWRFVNPEGDGFRDVAFAIRTSLCHAF